MPLACNIPDEQRRVVLVSLLVQGEVGREDAARVVWIARVIISRGVANGQILSVPNSVEV